MLCRLMQRLSSESHGTVSLTVLEVPTGTYYLAVDAPQGISGTYDLELSCGGRGGSGATTVYLPLTLRNH